MKLIVGLGNPGSKYQNTRHNFGFVVLDALAHELGFDFEESSKFEGDLATWDETDHGKIFFLKPTTFMNLSGRSVGAVSRFYKISPQDIFVVFDDLDLPLGRIKMARKGGSAGHNGIRSIIDSLGTQDFPRLKLGIGRPKIASMAASDYVLQRFTADETSVVEETVQRGCQATQAYWNHGLTKAMNEHNTHPS